MNIITELRSKLCNDRPPNTDVTTVVLHATVGLSLSGILRAFDERKVSAHYIVKKDGTVVKVVPLTKRAWHAGMSLGPDGPDVNDYSIGIEIVNRNNGKDPYPQSQVHAVRGLLNEIEKQFPGILWVTTHADICMPEGRKSDPIGFPLTTTATTAGYEVWRRGYKISKKL